MQGRVVALAIVLAALVQVCLSANPGMVQRPMTTRILRRGGGGGGGAAAAAAAASLRLRGGRSGSEGGSSGTDFSKMKIADLVGLCKTKGLATHGNKAEVVKRLQEAEEAEAGGGGGGDGHNKRAFPGAEEGEENANVEQPAKKPSVQREPEVPIPWASKQHTCQPCNNPKTLSTSNPEAAAAEAAAQKKQSPHSLIPKCRCAWTRVSLDSSGSSTPIRSRIS